MTERRRDPRLPGAALGVTAATMRPGRAVCVVDVSPGGAQVESTGPLRPGSRVHLRLVAACETVHAAAQVLRCHVAMLCGETGVVYRAALRFEERCPALAPGSSASSEAGEAIAIIA
jgi:hypothetical protein